MDDLYRRLSREVPGALSSTPAEPGPAEPDYDNANRGGIRRVFSPQSLDVPQVADFPDSVDPLGSLAGEVPPELAEDSERLARSVDRGGLEALAWYRSFHFGLAQWGIYLREEGIWHVADALAGPTESPADRLIPARDLLLWHEYFHFVVDVAVTTLEVSTKAPLYVPRLNQLKGEAPGYGLLEEALATGFAFDRTSVVGGKRRLRKFLDRTPPGYRNYDEARTRLARSRAAGGLLESYLTRAVNRTYGVAPDVASSVLGRLLNEDAPETPIHAVPVWLVGSGPESTLRFLPQITEITETKQFQKDLKKADPRVAKLWEKAKGQLAAGTRVGGTNFEKFRQDLYTVRLNRAIRALLRDSGDNGWLAERVGSHEYIYGR